jgi:protein-S-isoprenylcysteine O-methyltransferase Ste14
LSAGADTRRCGVNTIADFTTDPEVPRPPKPAVERYDPEPEREKIRGQIAVGLLLLLGAVVAAAFASLWLKWTSTDDLLKVLNVLFGSLIGLVGAVTGFYYGSAGARTKGS